MPEDVGKFLMNLGVATTLFVVVWYLLTKFIPRMMDKFLEALTQQRESFEARLKDLAKEQDDRNKAIVSSLDNLTAEVRNFGRGKGGNNNG